MNKNGGKLECLVRTDPKHRVAPMLDSITRLRIQQVTSHLLREGRFLGECCRKSYSFIRRATTAKWCLYASFVGALVLLLLILGSQSDWGAESHGQYLVYVGTMGSQSKGIYAYRFNEETRKITSLGLAVETANPFSLVSSQNGRYLYAANIIGRYEGKESGSVSAFAINNQTGKLTLLDQVPSRGSDPAYVSIDRTGRFVLVANYTGGSVAVLPIRKGGSLGEITSLVQHTGSSVNPRRQRSPHPHSINVSPDNRFALSADLGLDKLFVYRFNSATGVLSQTKTPYAMVKPGSGPRHFVFSPNGRFVYVISEMGSIITVFSYNSTSAALRNLQVVSTLPKGYAGENTGAEVQVAPSGRFLYASNRGDNTIAVFTISAQKGTLTPIEYAATQGKTPGMFAIDPTGSYLFVANKNSDDVVVFGIHQTTGLLTPIERVLSVPGPVCITFVVVH